MDLMTDTIYENKDVADAAVPHAERARPARLSLAVGLYGLILLGAAVLRFSALDSLPLSPDEAHEALAAWQVFQPGATAAQIGSPAYFSLTSLLMPFLGVSDVTARLVPALFGWGLVALPWLLRRELKPAGALVAGLLLAVSPLFTAVSRTAGGDALALFALLLLVAAVMRAAGAPDRRWAYVAAVALGLGLASSPLFYAGLATAIPAWWVARQVITGERARLWPPRRSLGAPFLVAVVLCLLLSTRFLAYPPGFAATAGLLGAFLGQFSLSGSLAGLLAPVLAIGRYETAVILLGLPALFWAIWRNQSFGTFLTYWILTAFALILLQRGELNNALLAVLPGYLLVGVFAGALLQQRLTLSSWAVMGSLLLVAGIMLVNITRYLRVSQTSADAANLWFAFLALAFGALALYYFWSMTPAAIPQAVLAALIVILALYQWGTAWHLTHVSANDPRERWVEQGADDDLPFMLETLREISNQATNSDAGLTLFSTVDSPLLRWYLRDYGQAQYGATIPAQARYQVLLTPATSTDPVLGDTYFGGDFGWLRSGATEAPPSASPLTDSLRNWLFHETAQDLTEERLILWVRSDILQGEQ